MRWTGVETHSVTEVNTEGTHGVCALCGPVRVYAARVRDRKYWRCVEGQLKRRREWAKNNPEALEDQRLRKKYGITLIEYNQMLQEQDGKCARCKRPACDMKIRLAVDHCHKTGVVRKLLCASCNTYLGKLEANRDRIEQDLLYLDTGSFELMPTNN